MLWPAKLYKILWDTSIFFNLFMRTLLVLNFSWLNNLRGRSKFYKINRFAFFHLLLFIQNYLLLIACHWKLRLIIFLLIRLLLLNSLQLSYIFSFLLKRGLLLGSFWKGAILNVCNFYLSYLCASSLSLSFQKRSFILI